MTQEEKNLIERDLCARLPYGVKVLYNDKVRAVDSYFPVEKQLLLRDEHGNLVFGNKRGKFEMYIPLEVIKPYLRPLSSMTDEEEREINSLLGEIYDFSFKMDELLEEIVMQKTVPCAFIDWLNAHHFDYRGLIPKSLAIEAPKEMYKVEE